MPDNKTTVTMTDVISYVDVSYESSDIGTYVAGLIGASQNGKITLLRCANLGAITGKSFAVGGLVGYLTSGSSIKECYNAGSVTQNKNDIAGGLVGKLDGGTIEDCYNNASVKACFTSGRATGTAGGLAGNIDNGAIKNCYNAGEVSAVQTGTVAGSIRALEDLTQTNCYALTAPAYGNKKDDTSVSVKTADEPERLRRRSALPLRRILPVSTAAIPFSSGRRLARPASMSTPKTSMSAPTTASTPSRSSAPTGAKW